MCIVFVADAVGVFSWKAFARTPLHCCRNGMKSNIILFVCWYENCETFRSLRVHIPFQCLFIFIPHVFLFVAPRLLYAKGLYKEQHNLHKLN